MKYVYDPIEQILTVIETVHSFSSTKQYYWHYDIVNWLRNANGIATERPTEPMCEASIVWVKKHYLPKVGL